MGAGATGPSKWTRFNTTSSPITAIFDPITTDEHPDPAAEAEAVDEAAQAALDLERRRAVREADSADLDRATHARRGRRRMRLGNQSVWTTTDSRGKLNAA